jgi:acylphosphatase
MRKRVELKIYGKVQGVFFRETSRMEAKKLNLVGWVRNEPDGTVKIVAEGEDKDLNRMIEWCKYGPDNAEVERVKAEWVKPVGEFSDFVAG